MSYSTYYKFYTKEYQDMEKLSDKTDFCDACIKSDLKLKSRETSEEEKFIESERWQNILMLLRRQERLIMNQRKMQK